MSERRPKGKAGHTDSTRALISEGAKLRGQARSNDVGSRVRAVMKSIEQEMDENNGIYPHNKGAVSANEVARRAEIHPTTFFTAAQRQLGVEVKNWITSLKTRKIVGRVRVRRELATRISDWRQMYDALAASHHKTELDLQQSEAELVEARKEVEALKQQVVQVRALLDAATANKVSVLPKRKV
jgi:hypothetical protein